MPVDRRVDIGLVSNREMTLHKVDMSLNATTSMMQTFPGRFAGQNAVITGGGSGIGRTVAERLAAEGARVSVWDISESALAELGASCAHKVHVDQSDEAAVARATAATVERFGSIDILVV